MPIMAPAGEQDSVVCHEVHRGLQSLSMPSPDQFLDPRQGELKLPFCGFRRR
jgi:hypothetical protein